MLYIIGAYTAPGVWEWAQKRRAKQREAHERVRWQAEIERLRRAEHAAIMRDLEARATHVYILKNTVSRSSRRSSEVEKLRS